MRERALRKTSKMRWSECKNEGKGGGVIMTHSAGSLSNYRRKEHFLTSCYWFPPFVPLFPPPFVFFFHSFLSFSPQLPSFLLSDFFLLLLSFDSYLSCEHFLLLVIGFYLPSPFLFLRVSCFYFTPFAFYYISDFYYLSSHTHFIFIFMFTFFNGLCFSLSLLLIQLYRWMLS